MDDTAAFIICSLVGLTMTAFGINQILHPKPWLVYIPHVIEKLILTRLSILFMRSHGVINLLLGILFAIGVWQPLVAWLTFAWWLSILPFALIHSWKIGLRDLAIIGAILAVALR